VVLRPVKYDKEARSLAQSARFEWSRVQLPKAALWLAIWLNKLLAFPNGRHDDQVDSISGVLDWLSRRIHSLYAAQEPRERPKSTPRPAEYNRPPGFARR